MPEATATATALSDRSHQELRNAVPESVLAGQLEGHFTTVHCVRSAVRESDADALHTSQHML